MDAVTTDAGGDACLPGLQQLAVDAGVVFAFLIDAQRRIEPLHQVRIAVALATVCRNVERLWLSQVTLPRVLRSFFGVGVGIAAMTIVARQSTSMMDVVVEEFGGRAQSR